LLSTGCHFDCRFSSLLATLAFAAFADISGFRHAPKAIDFRGCFQLSFTASRARPRPFQLIFALSPIAFRRY
jgi:hypothetical protein